MIGKTITALETAYYELNEILFDNSLPDVCITIQHAKKKKNSTILGWFSTQYIWTREKENEMFELNITSECLNQTYIDILGTLVHEMVHVYCHFNNIEDCRGKKHTTEFKEEAEKVGLVVERHKSVGWGITSVGLELRDKLINLNIDEDDFNIICNEIVIEKEPTEKKPKPVFVCPGCQEKIKSKNLELAIKCVKCNQQFELILEEPKQKED